MTSDRIEKKIFLKATTEKVWAALTDYRKFGEWFRVRLELPFVLNCETYGHITYPGYEYLRMSVMVVKLEPMVRFAFTWHPYAIDPNSDYSSEQPTTVEFELESVDNGVWLTVVESGFDSIPAHRRDLAYRMNDGGWTEQMKNIAEYVDGNKVE